MGIKLLLKLPLMLAALIIIAVVILIIITAFTSCDFNQINYSGSYNLTAGFDEVLVVGCRDDIRVDFEFFIDNLGETPIVGYIFAWAANESICSQEHGMWPENALMRNPTPPQDYPDDRNLQIMEGYKEGYYVKVSGGRQKQTKGSIVIPCKSQKTHGERLSETTKVLIILYDVFGKEMIRATYP